MPHVTLQIDGGAFQADHTTNWRDRTGLSLGNGLCTRPVELECRMESACVTCAYFATGREFIPVLPRQRDHAHEHHRPDRAALFDGLLNRIEDHL